MNDLIILILLAIPFGIFINWVINIFTRCDCKLTKEDKEFLRELLDEAEKEEATVKK